MKIAGLFAGIGGLERGFQLAGFETDLMAEIDPLCRDVLQAHFPGANIVGDVAEIDYLPKVDVVLAGFPCQPYSQVGPTRGFSAGEGHIAQIFRLLDSRLFPPPHVVLENVPFIIHRQRGRALRHVIDGLENRGYRWAYRIVDTSAFGLPQRRRRWILVASRTANPASILLEQDAQSNPIRAVASNGFYWTEGSRGVGWAENAIPPLKPGSQIGIASPPAVWARRSGKIVVPRIKAAERLQGFDRDWTSVDSTARPPGARQRWRMIGNAVSVPLAEWIARRLAAAPDVPVEGQRIPKTAPLPMAAFYDGTRRYESFVGAFPVAERILPLIGFLEGDVSLLSSRATRGFRMRYEVSCLVKNRLFLQALRVHERSVA